MTRWSTVGTVELPSVRALPVPVATTGRAPVPKLPITIGSAALRPPRVQVPTASVNVSPRRSNIWSPYPARTSALARRMVRTGAVAASPVLASSPAELLT
jgi:hypothetical protein